MMYSSTGNLSSCSCTRTRTVMEKTENKETEEKGKKEEEEEKKEEGEVKEEGEDEDDDDEGPPPGWQSLPPPVPPLPTSQPPTDAEFAQLVCGSCRELLSYPQGIKHVKCSSCQAVNFVLEAPQVGIVKCGSCALLLMYQYGAPSVRCSSCRFVTEIGEHNRRPPWSVQQGQPAPPNSIS